MKEIERKFLVKDTSSISLESYNRRTITQDYLYNDNITTIRKRKIQEGENTKYYYTIKTDRSGKYSVQEIESQIEEEVYNKLKLDENRNTIIKDRYNIPTKDGLIIELDVFHGIYEGIVFAEVEFPSEKEAEEFKVPDWFDKELTGKITNNMMTRMNREKTDEVLNTTYKEEKNKENVENTNTKLEIVKNNKRSYYLDFLKIIACFLVIVNHAGGHILINSGYTKGATLFYSVCFSICKIAVPIFVMVTGALLLTKEQTYKSIGKRIFRILIPLIRHIDILVFY